MHSTSNIGAIIREFRKAHNQSIADLAKDLGVQRAYLNKIELGKVKPSAKMLDRILVHFKVEGENALRIKQLAGFSPISKSDGRKEVVGMTDNAPAVLQPAEPQQISVNPMQTPVLYTDSTFVSSSDYGLVLDVAQTIGGQQHNVVARIGMSFEHAKKLIEVMNDNIQKYER